MGSWKETCMMSNLPIHYGDEVAAFVLRPTYNVDKEGTVCYADDRYAPLGFPVRGKYDDYGCVEQITNAEMHDTLFRQNQYYIKTGTDAATNTSTFAPYKWSSVQQFLKDVSRRKIYMNVCFKQRELTIVFTHLELCNRLLENVANRIPYNETEKLSVLVGKRVAGAIAEYQSMDEKAMFMTGILCELLHLEDAKHRHLEKAAKAYLDTQDAKYMHGMMNYILWHHVMDLSRKGYCVNSGRGGDETEYLLHAIIAEFIMEKCEEYKRQAIEDDPDTNPNTILEESLYWFN